LCDLRNAMKKLSYFTNRLASALSAVSCWLMIVLGVAMCIVVLLQVFFRFVIYVPFPWSEELARYLMIWLGMVGSFVALRKGRHIGVTILIERLPEKIFAILAPVLQAIMIAFLLTLAVEGMSLALFNAAQKSPAMQIPMFYPYLAVPVGTALMIIELCAGILDGFFPTDAGIERRSAAPVT